MKAGEPQEAKKQDRPQKQTYWDQVWKPEVLPVWFGVVGTVAACLIGVGTLRKISKQTEAIEHQVGLQIAAMKQWVELKPLSSREKDGKLEVSFSLKNPTNFLIILDQVSIEFAPAVRDKYFLVVKHTPLPPNEPLRINILLPLSEPRMNAFKMGETCLPIQWRVVFVKALGGEETQNYNGFLCCSPTETTLESRISPNTEERAK